MIIKNLENHIINFYNCSNFGVGFTKAQYIYKKIGINVFKNKTESRLPIENFKYLRKNDDRVTYGFSFRRATRQHLKFLNMFGNYRALRRNLSLPCNGQRTKTNARCVKSKRLKNISEVREIRETRKKTKAQELFIRKNKRKFIEHLSFKMLKEKESLSPDMDLNTYHLLRRHKN